MHPGSTHLDLFAEDIGCPSASANPVPGFHKEDPETVLLGEISRGNEPREAGPNNNNIILLFNDC